MNDADMTSGQESRQSSSVHWLPSASARCLTLAASFRRPRSPGRTAAGVDGTSGWRDGDSPGFLAGDAATLTEAVFDLALVT